MDNNIKTIQDIYAAFGRGDVEAILEHVADSPDWSGTTAHDLPQVTKVPFLRNVRTKTEVASTYFGGVAETIDVHSFVPKLFMSDGNHVLTLLELQYTVKATGKQLAIEEIHHFTFDDDGRIERYRPYLDTAAVVAAFGD